MDERSSSRLLVNKASISHRTFKDIVEFIDEGDLLILNNTSVIHARIFGKKESGGSIEVMLERFMENNEALVQIRSGRSPLIYHFPRSLFEQLPLDEPKFEFKTCAVVGNSGVTLLKEYGEEIDNHDAVIRINMAPIRGFEKYVGKRTTFDVVNSHNVREILQGVRRWRPANEGETKLVLFETASHFARYHLCQPLLKKYGAENAILLNPLFSNRAHSLWIKLKELLEKTKNSQYNRKPMSGFFAVLYALQMCEKVDLYGFDAYTSRKKSYRYHYFDNVQGFTDVHSFDLAIEVFKFIAKKGTKGGLTINV